MGESVAIRFLSEEGLSRSSFHMRRGKKAHPLIFSGDKRELQRGKGPVKGRYV